MGSSKELPRLAAEEAVKVRAQSENLWNSLKTSLGERYEDELAQSQADAVESFGDVGENSPPADVLAFYTHMLATARRLHKELTHISRNK